MSLVKRGERERGRECKSGVMPLLTCPSHWAHNRAKISAYNQRERQRDSDKDKQTGPGEVGKTYQWGTGYT